MRDIAAILSGARHVTVVGVPGFIPYYKAHFMNTTRGARGGGVGLNGPDTIADRDGTPYNVHVVSVPQEVVERFERAMVILVVIGAIGVGLGVWIGVELEAVRTWTRSSAQTIAGGDPK